MRKRNLKKVFIGFTITSLLFATPIENLSFAQSISIAYRNIKICVDNNLLTPKDANGNVVEPFIHNGTTYLPVRAIGEALGKKVYWDSNSNTIAFQDNTPQNTPEQAGSANTATSVTSPPVQKNIDISFKSVRLFINHNFINPKDAKGNGIEAIIFNGTTYLPVRAVGEAFGKKVSWNGNTCTVYIKSTPDQFVSDAPPIEWCFIGPGSQPDTAQIESEANRYLKDKLNVSLKLTCFDWGTYSDKMAVKEASGETFDICFTADWSNDYYKHSQNGDFVDLTDMMDNYAPKTKALLGENIIKGASVNGRLYAVPSLKSKAHNLIYCLKHDLVSKYKIDISKIKRFEDIEPYLKVIHDKEAGVYPFESSPGRSAYNILDFEKIAGDDVPGAFDPVSSKVINDFESPQAKAFYKTLHKWYKAGYIRKDADTVYNTTDEMAGKIFAYIQPGYPGSAEETSLQQGVKWDQADLTNPAMTSPDVVGSMQAISSTSKDPAKALQFLELFNTDKYLNNLINFGIEGEHYIKTGDNTIDFAPGTGYGKMSGYNPQTGWMFGNQMLNYLLSTDNPKKWEKFKEFNSSAVPSKLLGFHFNPDPVRSEITAVERIKLQFFPILETGKGDPDVVLPLMTKRMKEAGLDKVLAEMQAQVDEFLAKSK